MTIARIEPRSTVSVNRHVAGPPIDGQKRTAFQVSMDHVARMQEAISAARREAAQAAAQNPDGPGQRTPRGRPPEPGSVRDVAQRTGISPRQQQRFARHVALADAYPLFQDARWTMLDALKAGALLEALSADQRRNVVPRLAGVEPPRALRLLHTLVRTPRRVVPTRPAPASRPPASSAPDSVRAMPASAVPVTGATPSEADLQRLVTARRLVRCAAGLVRTTELCLYLKEVDADLYRVLCELGLGAAVLTARLARKPLTSALLTEANTLVLQVAQRLSDPSLQARLQRIARAIHTGLLRVSPPQSGVIKRDIDGDVLQFLRDARARVRYAAERVDNSTVYARLQRVGYALDDILAQSGASTPATMAARGDIFDGSLIPVATKAQASMLRAAQRCLDPNLRAHVQRLATELDAIVEEMRRVE